MRVCACVCVYEYVLVCVCLSSITHRAAVSCCRLQNVLNIPTRTYPGHTGAHAHREVGDVGKRLKHFQQKHEEDKLVRATSSNEGEETHERTYRIKQN